MLNCRSIPSEVWIRARERLIFFFSRRHGLENAEDLAHQTLMTVLSRDDYMFEKEEDFFKVCYGFARHILHEANRPAQKHLEVDLYDIEATTQPVKGLRGAEVSAFLGEVRCHAKAELLAEEWAQIEAVVNGDDVDHRPDAKLRVQLHRVRKKLAKLTGWSK
jgi:hypothetical protein